MKLSRAMMSDERRTEIAKKAATKPWGKKVGEESGREMTNLNISEGLRRCSLLLGMTGGIVGAVLGYQEADKVWRDQCPAAAIDYDALAKRAGAISSQPASPPLSIVKSEPLPPGATLVQPALPPRPAVPPARQPAVSAFPATWDGAVKRQQPIGQPAAPEAGYTLIPDPSNLPPPPVGYTVKTPEKGPWTKYSDLNSQLAAQGGWQSTADHAPHTIEVDPSQVSDVPLRPSKVRYVLAAVWPLLGFVIPWGAFRLLVWTVMGFFQH